MHDLPQLTAPGTSGLTLAQLHIDAAGRNLVVLRVRNEAANVEARIAWTTADEPYFDETKSTVALLQPGLGASRACTIRLAGHPGWKGTITGLQLTIWHPDVRVDAVEWSRLHRAPIRPIGAVSRIEVGERAIVITGKIDAGYADSLKDNRLSLYELKIHERESDIAGRPPLLTMPAGDCDDHFSFVVDRFDGTRDRYYAKFVVALHGDDEDDVTGAAGLAPAGRFVDSAKYATDVLFAPANEYPFPAAPGKKGIFVNLTDDAEELGIAHGLLNVTVNESMLHAGTDDLTDAIPFEVEGATYYFKRPFYEKLDAQVKLLTDNGVVMTFVLILTRHHDRITQILTHPDASKLEGLGTYAFNVVDEEGVRHLRAAFEFLAARYTREDKKYGRVVNFIVGNEIDAQWEWQNMGDKTVHEFVDHYADALRLCHMAMRKHYGEARIYLSLTNNWMRPHKYDADKYYRGRDIVDLLNAHSKRHGDYPWHLAFHAYPEDFFNLDTWADDKALDTADSPHITFRNLHVLTAYMEREELLYRGERRRVILSEQGFHTQDESPETQTLQAAAYAYAYYKAHFLDGIDAFILFSQIDVPFFGLLMGLWTQDPDADEAFVPLNAKRIHDVFRRIDTPQSLESTSFALPVIGIDSWHEAVPNFDPDALAVRAVPDTLPLRAEYGRFDPATGMTGDSRLRERLKWEAADYATIADSDAREESYAEEGTVQVAFSAHARKWRGIQAKLHPARSAVREPIVRLNVKLTGTAADESYRIRVKAYSGREWAAGVVRVDPAQGWITLTLDLGAWNGRHAVDRLKIWAVGESSLRWTGRLLIGSLEFCGQRR